MAESSVWPGDHKGFKKGLMIHLRRSGGQKNADLGPLVTAVICYTTSFTGRCADDDVGKSRHLEPMPDIASVKPRPAVMVFYFQEFIVVFFQIGDDHPATRFEYTVHLFNCRAWTFNMM